MKYGVPCRGELFEIEIMGCQWAFTAFGRRYSGTYERAGQVTADINKVAEGSRQESTERVHQAILRKDANDKLWAGRGYWSPPLFG